MSEKQTYTIDAKDQILGRLASQVAVLLRGKNDPDFAPNKDSGNTVIIKNVDKIRFTGRKDKQKKYYHHSGYLGGLKEKPLKELFEEKPEEVFKKAVWGMLPKNRMRSKMIIRLKFQ
jgi:large subunit ribosomal protein L13